MENPGTKYGSVAGKIKALNERPSIATIDYRRVNLEVNQCDFFQLLSMMTCLLVLPGIIKIGGARKMLCNG